MTAVLSSQAGLASVRTIPGPIPPGAAGTPPEAPFRATLTETTNPYLRDRLPLQGYVKVISRDIYGNVLHTRFMPDPKTLDGLTSFVVVPNARYEFGSIR